MRESRKKANEWCQEGGGYAGVFGWLRIRVSIRGEEYDMLGNDTQHTELTPHSSARLPLD